MTQNKITHPEIAELNDQIDKLIVYASDKKLESTKNLLTDEQRYKRIAELEDEIAAIKQTLELLRKNDTKPIQTIIQYKKISTDDQKLAQLESEIAKLMLRLQSSETVTSQNIKNNFSKGITNEEIPHNNDIKTIQFPLIQIPEPKNYTNEKTIYVYFIKKGDMVKIGKSADPQRRLLEIQTSTPDPIELLYTTNKFYENELHKKFENYHKRGEWFFFSYEIEDFIRQLKMSEEKEKALLLLDGKKYDQ